MELVSSKELAGRLGVSLTTLGRWRVQGRIRARELRLGVGKGQAVAWDADELRPLMAELRRLAAKGRSMARQNPGRTKLT